MVILSDNFRPSVRQVSAHAFKPSPRVRRSADVAYVTDAARFNSGEPAAQVKCHIAHFKPFAQHWIAHAGEHADRRVAQGIHRQ